MCALHSSKSSGLANTNAPAESKSWALRQAEKPGAGYRLHKPTPAPPHLRHTGRHNCRPRPAEVAAAGDQHAGAAGQLLHGGRVRSIAAAQHAEALGSAQCLQRRGDARCIPARGAQPAAQKREYSPLRVDAAGQQRTNRQTMAGNPPAMQSQPERAGSQQRQQLRNHSVALVSSGSQHHYAKLPALSVASGPLVLRHCHCLCW